MSTNKENLLSIARDSAVITRTLAGITVQLAGAGVVVAGVAIAAAGASVSMAGVKIEGEMNFVRRMSNKMERMMAKEAR